MKKIIFIGLLLLNIGCFAQTKSVAVGYQYGNEWGDTGNSIGNSVFVNASIEKARVQFDGDIVAGLEKKNYLFAYGRTLRANATVRYWGLKVIAPQAGITYSYFNIKQVAGGYSKHARTFYYGGAARYGRFLVDYKYRPEVEIRSENILDGYSKGQSVRTEVFLPRHYYLYVDTGKYTYRRAASSYGQAAASINHNYNAVEIGVGYSWNK